MYIGFKKKRVGANLILLFTFKKCKFLKLEY
jgi:hypothetical protein